jgi:hypothetical protein
MLFAGSHCPKRPITPDRTLIKRNTHVHRVGNLGTVGTLGTGTRYNPAAEVEVRMSRKRPPCSCGGSNENCQRCFGSGWVESGSSRGGFGSVAGLKHSAPSISSRTSLPDAPPPRPDARPPFSAPILIACRHCGGMVLASGLSSHLRRWHPRPLPAAVQKPARAIVPRTSVNRPHVQASGARPGLPAYVKCTICGVKLKAGRVARHMRNVHEAAVASPLVAARSPIAAPRRVATSPKAHTAIARVVTPTVMCPACGQGIAATAFGEHMRRSHPGVRPQLTEFSVGAVRRPERGAATEGSNGLPEDSGLFSPDQTRIERSLDGTRGQHVFREHGRFGSASSHDNYGDDSGA